MTVYTNVFGGTTLYPSDVSYLALSLTEDTVLQWPLESAVGNNLAARIIDVTPTGAYAVIMPPADQTGVGQVTMFKNLGPSTITIKNNAGGTLLSISAGLTFTLYLTDNTTAAGSWQSFQAGASTAQAQASNLAGFGLIAQGSVLSQSQDVVLFNSNYTLGVADRATAYVWDGGAGTLTLPLAPAVGNNWFISTRNGGQGDLTIAAQGINLINGAATLVLRPGDSATVLTDGVDFYTVGYGQQAVFAFDYTVIDLTGQSSPYTLSGTELNRISYKFIGTLAADMDIVLPSTIQQYWIDNQTTGGFLLNIGTSTQVPFLTVPNGARGIYYCDGTSLVRAETASLATPISIADGGTGATTAGGALINLGGTTVGIGVFTAANTGAARTALAAAASGANSDITSLSGLTTPLSVPQGGTGAATLTGYVKGSGTSAFTASATIPTSDLSGTLGVANGGTGAATLTGYVKGSGTSAFTASATIPASDLSGTLGVANGGTGAATLTGYVKGSGTSAFTASATIPASDLSGTLGVANGGTGAATLTGYVKGSGTSAFTASATIPASDLSGTLGVANGGTGQTSYTDGQLLIGNTTGNTLTKTTLTAGSGVSITNGSGSITISATGSGGSVTSVALSGGTTGLTASGSPITTSGTITLAGTLATANGGTGLTGTPTNGQLLIGNGSGYSLATLTAGSNVTITNSSGGITIAATGGGGSGTVTSVSGSGGSTGLTLSGGPITTSGTLTLGGTLALANGGTGATTASGARSALDVPSTTGSGASGTWGISISGNAATATALGSTLAIAGGGTGATTAAGARTNLDVPSTTGSGASGTWGISISGNAATATALGSTLAIAGGGTGATTAAGARTNLDVPSTTGSGASGTWGIGISGNAATATTAGALTTTNSYTMAGLTVNGAITATGNITAYYSDERLKRRLGDISNPVLKVMQLNGFYYEANEAAQALGYLPVREIGVSAQDVRAVVPEAVHPAPIDAKYLTVDYARLVPLLIEAIKEQQREIEQLIDDVTLLRGER